MAVSSSPSATADAQTARPCKGPVRLQRTFEAQLQLDRQMVKRFLAGQVIKDSKWKQMTPKDREALVRDKVVAKLVERETSTRKGMTTARKAYPSKVNDKDFVQYFIDYYWLDIEATVDKDDVEPLPIRRTRIKREPSYDFEVLDEEETEVITSNKDINEFDQKEDDGEDEPKDQFACRVISRGFVIQSDGIGFGGFRMKTKPNTTSKPTPALPTNRLITRSITKQQKWKHAKHSWKWVDGKMVVWPVLDTTF